MELYIRTIQAACHLQVAYRHYKISEDLCYNPGFKTHVWNHWVNTVFYTPNEIFCDDRLTTDNQGRITAVNGRPYPYVTISQSNPLTKTYA